MRTTFLSATLAVVAGVSALPSPQLLPSLTSLTDIVQALPLEIFDAIPKIIHPVTLEDAKRKFEEHNATQPAEPPAQSDRVSTLAAGATCSNPRVRVEWDSYPDSSKQQYVDAIKCLMGRAPSGQFPASRSRYEDIVALHQTLTPNVHANAKFLPWHRYLLWVFEDMLRSDCGFNQPIPWFDETKYAGRFSQSSVFSSKWFGSIGLGGACVTNGAFANLAINIGPGMGNTLHCLSRNGDAAKTQYCNSDFVNQCNAYNDYAGMADCAETGPHAWGHNGVGGVMGDTASSPADPFFWLHHAFVDRNFRIWQNANSARVNSIGGNDISGRPLTLDTNINVYGFRPDVKIRDVLDTTGTTLCYKYNY